MFGSRLRKADAIALRRMRAAQARWIANGSWIFTFTDASGPGCQKLVQLGYYRKWNTSCGCNMCVSNAGRYKSKGWRKERARTLSLMEPRTP